MEENPGEAGRIGEGGAGTLGILGDGRNRTVSKTCKPSWIGTIQIND